MPLLHVTKCPRKIVASVDGPFAQNPKKCDVPILAPVFKEQLMGTGLNFEC
jgi:hypothetical protein